MIKDLFLNRGSVIHRLNLWTKVVPLLLVVPACAFLGSESALLIVIASITALLICSRISLPVIWSQTKGYLVFFIIASGVMALIFSSGGIGARIHAGVLWSARFGIVVLAAAIFSLVTDPIEIPMGLLSLGIPHKYGVTLMVAIRMMPLVAHNLRKVLETQKTRGVTWSVLSGDWSRFPRQGFAVAVPCIITTLEVAVALADTLIARGYEPDGRMTRWPVRAGGCDVLIAAMATAMSAAVVWLTKGS